MGKSNLNMAGKLSTRTPFMTTPKFRNLILSLVVTLYTASLEARSWLEDIDAKVFGESAQEESFESGVSLYKAGKYDEALEKFQRATVGENSSLKARALHNIGNIQAEAGDLKSAAESYRNALAFDNDLKETKENLAWVNAQKEKEKQDQKQEQQEQKQENDPNSKQDEQSAGENDKNEQKSSEDSKSAEKEAVKKGQEGDQKVAEENKEKAGDPKQEPKEDQEKARAGEDDKDKAQDGEKNSAKDEQTEGEQTALKPSKDEKDEAEGDQSNDPMLEKKSEEGSAILTPAEIKQQEAERLLRTIEDKMGRYPLTDTEATTKRGKDGKNW